MALSNNDTFVCQRGDENFRVTAKQIKEYADQNITAGYVEVFGNIITQGDFFLTEGDFQPGSAHVALFNQGNGYFADRLAGVNEFGVMWAQDFTKVTGPQTIEIDEAGTMTADLSGSVSLFDLIENLTTRIEQLEADHASAMNNMEDENGSSAY